MTDLFRIPDISSSEHFSIFQNQKRVYWVAPFSHWTFNLAGHEKPLISTWSAPNGRPMKLATIW